MSYYLGIEIDIRKDITTICQIVYLYKVLDKFGFNDYKPYKTPIDLGIANYIEPSIE